jgi:hypothetical protein
VSLPHSLGTILQVNDELSKYRDASNCIPTFILGQRGLWLCPDSLPQPPALATTVLS